jgi:FkbM family methyltransferase
MSRKLLLFATGAVIVVGFAAIPSARLAALYAVGRSEVCPFDQSIDAARHVRLLKEANDRISSSHRLLQRDAAGYEQYQTLAGTWWVPKGSEYVLPFNLAEQELDIYATGGDLPIKSGDIVLDCGANVGVFTRKVLDHGAGKVIAIEPAPENIECLRRNFPAEIADGRVIVYEKGVWDKDDFLEMNVDPNNSAGDSFVIQREGSHKIRLPLTTIDKLVAELGLPRVDYIKMDIEGAEPNALRGGAGSIAKWKPRLSLAAYHEPDHPRTIPQTVRSIRPDYTMQCGPCEEHHGRIGPDILYFK